MLGMAEGEKINVDEVSKVNVVTPRLRKRFEEFRDLPRTVSAARSRLVTESWKETEGEPVVVRKAKAFQKICEAIPIIIRDGELIVGSQTEDVHGCFAVPEWDPSTYIKEFKKSDDSGWADSVEFELLREEAKKILEDCRYWEGRATADKIRNKLRELWGDRMFDLHQARAWMDPFSAPPSGCTVDYEKVLTKGLKGVITEIEEELAKPIELTEEGIHKVDLLKSMMICCKAVGNYASRHAELARKLADQEANMQRKKELDGIAEACEWVPENPPRSFYEALQSWWFIHLILYLETAASSKSPGRFDQYLYPFYAKDIHEGTITRQQAGELVGCVWLKLNELETYRPLRQRAFAQSSGRQNLCIGGVNRDGSDATNELSYLILEVERQMGLPQPQLSLRYHDGLPHDFLVKAAETIRDEGGGKPAFFNDKLAILSLTGWGIPLEEARDYAIQGCVEKYIPYRSGSYRRCNINFAKVIEMVLTNGVDRLTGKQLFPATGDPVKFSSFEEFYTALKKQFTYLIENITSAWNVGLVIRGQDCPIPFHSALHDDCMSRGLDAMEGGLRYNQLLAGIDVVGLQNVADSLAAIKKLVYEEKKLTMSELLETLAVNFKGKEKIRKMLLTAPKFGNDDDYVDYIMKDIFDWTEKIVKDQKNPWGQPYSVTRKGLTAHFYFGKTVGALPDGRDAFTPLADGSLSPMRGMDTHGPTAVFNSASKVDQSGSEATLINQKFTKGALASRESMEKFLALVKTYFDNYGYHAQFNMVDPETLLDAKAHPEKYKNLLVRVAGYSAYFVELSPEVQDDIINRNTQPL